MRLPNRSSATGAALVVVAGMTVWALAEAAPRVLRANPDAVRTWTVDGGGGESSNGSLAVRGTAGEPDAGVLTDETSGTGLGIRGGFWAGATEIVTGVANPPSPNRDLLLPPAPNPFNPRTTIRFELATDAHATVQVFDVRGRVVRTLIDEALPAGPHDVEWEGRADDGRPVSSGVFYLRLTADGRTQTRKLTLVK